MNKKRRHPAIKGILVDGKWIDTPSRVKTEFYSRFANKFYAPDWIHVAFDAHFPRRLDNDQSCYLESDATNEEIKIAVWDCGSDKSSSPDGFTFEFFKNFGLLLQLINRGMFAPIFVGKDNLVPISHLLYADDAMFIEKWSCENVNVLMMMLEWFFLASGLKVNLHKNSLYGVGVRPSEVQSMADRYGCLANNPPFTHLCVKVGANMSRVNSWNEVVQMVKNKHSTWKAKTLFVGGRLTLIRSVLGAILTYYMSLFKISMEMMELLITPLRLVMATRDRWSWSLNGNGEFSVNSARKVIDNHVLVTASSPTRWSKDTANSGGKKETKAMVFHKMETEEISDRFVAPCFVNGMKAYDGEINLGVEENMISNEFAVKLCLDHEFIINREEDDVEPWVVFRRSFLRLTKAVADFGNETITIYPELDPFLMGKRSRNKRKQLEKYQLIFFDMGPSMSTGTLLTQKEAEREALAISICERYSLLEKRPVIETVAYSNKYKEILDGICLDKMKLDGIKKEEEKAIIKIKGEALIEKDDPGAFVIPIRLEGKINLNALVDTSSNINVMPYRIYKELVREEVHNAKKGFRMLNHSKAEPMRLLSNVLCQVAKTSLETAESDSDDEEEYAFQRNKFRAPVCGPKLARAAAEDSSLAREINGLRAGLSARIEEREYFIDGLYTLVDRVAEINRARSMSILCCDSSVSVGVIHSCEFCLVGEMGMDGVALCVWDAGMSTLLDGFNTLYGSSLVAEIGLK
nr:hypothetical protein [Tanacetum cinerariifolium]